MTMILYRIGLDLTILLHLGFILFVAGGGFLTWRWPRVGLIHWPAVIWGIIISFYPFVCPLTHLEKWLRREVYETSYSGGFIDYYLTPIIYPNELEPIHFCLIGVLVLVVNLIVYAKTIYKFYGTRLSHWKK